MKFKNILVTGGSGFIGSNFIHNIISSENTNVFNLDKLTYAGNEENNKSISQNKKYNFIHGDICDSSLIKKTLSENNIDLIVHFAAESHVDKSIDDPGEFLNTNILGTYNLLECASWHLKKMKNFVFLHVSTDEVYGSLEIGERPFKETNQIQPNSPYSASKASSDMLVRAWHHTYKLPTLTTNCSNNYGPFQYPEKLIPLSIDNAINLKPIKLYGDGSNIRDWLFVNDHCSGIKSVINNGKFGEIYNIGGLNEFSNLDIVKTICKLLDEKNHHLLVKKSIKSYSDLITFVEDRPGHDFRYSVDPSKLQKELGWSPEITFDEGISTTIDWYLDNQDWINALKRQN